MKNEYVISDFSSAVMEKDRVSTTSLPEKWEIVPYETAKISGSLLIASENSQPMPVTVDPALTGWYKIYACMTDVFGGNHIDLRLTDDEFSTTSAPGKIGRYAMWIASENAEEALWKCADMTGQKVEISKVRNGIPHTANLLWLRFVPMSEEEVEKHLAVKNDLSRKKLFAHMDGDFHANDGAKEPRDYCKALYAMKDSDVGIVTMEVINDLVEIKGYSEETAKLLLYTGGLRIVATIDPALQAKMDAVFTDLENFPGKLGSDGTMPQASMVVMDPYTGEVKALYGGRGEKTGDRVLNRATQTKRSPGSSIKPLTVYGPAIEAGIITPISIIDDVPKDFEIRANGWPKNENNVYSGKVTVETGIAKSLNTVAVDIVQKLTPEKSFDFGYNRLNLSSLVDSRVVTNKDGTNQVKTDKTPGAMALGGLTDGVTVLEMTAAYSAFVNDGYYTEPILYSKIYDAEGNILLEKTPAKTEAMSSKTATYMLELLKYAVSNGTGSRAALGNGIETGGKTGTTTSNYDRWFAGISPYYSGVVWFGYDKQQEVTGVSTNPALYLWKEVMSRIHEGLPARSFNETTDLVNVSYCLDSGKIPSDLCSQDERGSRVASGRVAKEDVPTEVCDCHVSVELCPETMLPATEFCKLDELVTVSRILVTDRIFPEGVEVAVSDSQYVFTEESICDVHNAENDANVVDPNFWPDGMDIPGSIDEWWNDRPGNDTGSAFENWWNSLFPSGDDSDPSVAPY